MVRKACAIVWMIPLLAVGLLSTCFNPDYGDGGFLCNHGNHDCPDGYTCLPDEGQLRCVKGPKAPDRGPGKDIGPPPLDLPPPDLRHQEGTAPDQGPLPVLQCSGGPGLKSLAGVLKGPQSFDLVVDKNKQLHVVFIDSVGYLRVRYPTGISTWGTSPIDTAATASLVAGGVDNDNRIHVIYADKNMTLRGATIKKASFSSGKWDLHKTQLHPSVKIKSVDLDHNRSPYESLYYAAGGEDLARSNQPMLILGRVTAKPSSITYDSFCQHQSPALHSRVAAYTTSGKAADHGGVSFFVPNGGYRFGYFDHSTSSCPSFEKFAKTGTPTPASLAMDTVNNKIQVALSTHVTGIGSLEADLQYVFWDGVSTFPLKAEPVLKKTVVDPLSVEMATHAKTNLTCLAFYTVKSLKGRALRIMCRSPLKNQWAISSSLQDISAPDYKLLESSGATGLRLDLGREAEPVVHLAFVLYKSLKHDLNYLSCKPK